MRVNHICLVSPQHLASNPRLVKEADALHEAGIAVRVIAGDATPGARPLDETILAQAPWPVVKVGLGVRPLYLARRFRQELARKAFGCGMKSAHVAVWAQSSVAQKLSRAAAAEPADLYIGHCLEALPAVAWAARRYRSKFGFDVEDDHVGELDDVPENQLEIAIRQKIEARFLPQCRHLTASSPCIAQVYRERYDVTTTPILNVFPLSLAPSAPPKSPNGDVLSVYWFSQTIGPDRGLEPVIEAMGKIKGRARLSIRGSDFLGYSAHLKTLANEAGIADAISFLPSAPPNQMALLAAQHDVGLASELSTPPNRAISLTNKVFTYLLAGVPVLLSDTTAQRGLASELGQAARVVDLTAPDAIVDALSSWVQDPRALAAAKCAAWRLGQTKFNWDNEKERFLQSVAQALK
jgi:glycosyltransferase involved in cell wall biosynthesis